LLGELWDDKAVLMKDVFRSTDLDPFRYHRLIEYCPFYCTHFSFIRSLVILYSRVVTPIGYEPLFKRETFISDSLWVIASTIVDASYLLRKKHPLPRLQLKSYATKDYDHCMDGKLLELCYLEATTVEDPILFNDNQRIDRKNKHWLLLL
jgi:hypothetical protein